MNFVRVKRLTGDSSTFRVTLIVLCVASFAVAGLFGQAQLPVTTGRSATYGTVTLTAPDTYNSGSLSQSPYLGGVPAGTATSTPLQFALEDAVARGLRQNLGGLLSTDAVSGAKGERWRALSALLPNLDTGTSFGVRQNDLKAVIGINIPGHPAVKVKLTKTCSRGFRGKCVPSRESLIW